jgi:glyoxylase-like metal-dependent hydrolase (beta-lactamase superfamily II)
MSFAHVLTVLLLAISTIASAASDEITLVPQRISEHCWFFQGQAGAATAANKGFMSNAGFVVTSDGVIVFDALGTPALGQAMITAIGKVTTQPVKRVIVSHYHADHIYGLQAFKKAGAQIWAHRKAEQYLASTQAVERLAQRRIELSPWVDNDTAVVPPDQWLDGDTDFKSGGLTFRIVYSQGGHSPEDILLYVVEDRVLFAGDLLFAGRLPFVGDADSKGWLTAMNRMLAMPAVIVIPGHGPASKDVARDLTLTRDYLLYLRETMGSAVKAMDSFDEAYARTDWSRFSHLPAFDQANRINAYGTFLTMEQEELQAEKPSRPAITTR